MNNLSFILFFFISFSSFSCEMTDEYLELRSLISDSQFKPYKNCVNASNESSYWTGVSNCILDARGQSVSECEQLVSHRSDNYSEQAKHCEVLKPTLDDFKNALLESAYTKNISKCE